MAALIDYRGAQVTAEWPSRIEAAQLVTRYTSNGTQYPRIPFGSDDPRWGARPCQDCSVVAGELHVPNCQYEHCPVCRASQLGTCQHRFIEHGTDGLDEPVSGPTTGDRVLAGLLGGVILLCVMATILVA